MPTPSSTSASLPWLLRGQWLGRGWPWLVCFALSAPHLAVYLDFSVRWFAGLRFISSPVWLLGSLLFTSALLLSFRWLLQRPGLCATAAACWGLLGCGVAATGSNEFAWWDAQLLGNLFVGPFKRTWLFPWIENAFYALPALTLAGLLLALIARQHARQATAATQERLLLATGLCCLGLLPYYVLARPNLVWTVDEPHKLLQPATLALRRASWLVFFGAATCVAAGGTVLLGYRRFWRAKLGEAAGTGVTP